jgi:GT2 family glycosyltransferase
MSAQVTVVVVPRDRFSSVLDCTKSILENTSEPIRLVYLDFGYSARQLESIRHLAREVPLEIISCGRAIPMAAFREYLPRIETPYVAWVDNDTYVTEGWLTAMLARAAQGARVILPLTLEREGLDIDPRKIPLRNHISHAELRGVEVNGQMYVFDYKPFRRAAPEELPKEAHTVDFFELHTFFAETEVLRNLDLPDMVVREHVDIGIQLSRMGIDIWSDPQSVVHFDNIHERPTWRDLKFFFFRWDEKLINQSHRLFWERWGYRFFNEQFMKNWAFRRKVYSVCRFLGLPSGISDFGSRVLNKLFRPRIPVELSHDPFPESTLVLHNSQREGAQVPVG